MSAERVALIGHRAFRQGRGVAVAGLGNQLLALSVRLVPRFVARRIVGSWNAAK